MGFRWTGSTEKTGNSGSGGGFRNNNTAVTYVPLAVADGKELGKISYKAYKAIESNTLDSYEPVNDEEKKVLDTYKNQSVTIPITNKKNITLRIGTKSAIDSAAKNDSKNKQEVANHIDDIINNLNLSQEELEDAKSYAGIKKLTLASGKTGEDSFGKEVGQFVAHFFKEAFDVAESMTSWFKDTSDKLNGDGDNSYLKRRAEIEKYYTENPDELGNDLYNRKNIYGVEGEYLDSINLDKAMEYFDDTHKATQFIAKTGAGSAGAMVAATATGNMLGLGNALSGVGKALSASKGVTVAKTALRGTKAAAVANKAASFIKAHPNVEKVVGTGIKSSVANKTIDAVNKLSFGTVAKLLNPLDNSTTAILGLSAAQNKYKSLIASGYSHNKAKKNAMFTGYITAITEKMGYNGKQSKMFKVGDNVVAGSASASKLKNVGRAFSTFNKLNASEGLEEIYNIVFERFGDFVSATGYIDENGDLQYRKFFGDEGVIDLMAIGESFLGGYIGGAFMGLGTAANLARSYNTKNAQQSIKTIISETQAANEVAKVILQEAGIGDVTLPEAPKEVTATVDDAIQYQEETFNAYADILKDERVIKHDEAVLTEATQAIEEIAKEQKKAINNESDTSTTPVAVGDTFHDTKTGTTLTVISRDANNTVVRVNESGIEKTYTNDVADMMSSNPAFEKVDSTSDTDAPQNTESADTLSPEDAQKYNILVSNLKRKAEELGLLDNNFYTALQSVNLYNPTASDRALIGSEFQRVFAGNTDPLVTGWLNAISVDAQSVTSINSENMPVTDKNTHINEDVTDTDVNKTVYEIMDELGLTYDEQRAILEYKSSGSYLLNEILRSGEEISSTYIKLKNDLNSALDKFPTYKGVVYRDIGFRGNDAKSQFDMFVEQHKNSSSVIYTDFTSASKSTDGYTVEAEYTVHYEILSETAKDVEYIGPTEEREVLFKTDTEFEVTEISVSGKNAYVKMKELTNYGTKDNNRAGENTGNRQNVEGRSGETRVDGLHEEIHTENDILRKRSSTDDRVSESQSERIGGGYSSSTIEFGGEYEEETRNVERTEGKSVRIKEESVTGTPESVTEPTESVIKKADSVTETPDTESAIPYTDREKQNWESSNTIIVYESDEQFEAYVEKVLNNEDTHKKIYFGKIPDATAQMVLDKTGVDVSGHNIALKGYEIRKILLNSHGDEEAEATRGQEPITTDDLKNIPSVITNPDDVNLSDKEYEGKPALLFEKTIDGKNYVVAYVSRKHHDIAIQTMYKKRSLATAENADALSSTPETTSSTASNNIVSQDNDIVNSSVRTDTKNDASKVYDVAYFEKLGSDIRKGESVSLKDVRTAVDAILLNHGEAIKAELSQLKNDELKKHLSIYDRGRITKKAEMVDSIYTDMLSSLYYALSGKETITYIYDGTGFEAQQSKMLFDISRELTEETFNKRLAENAEKYKKQVAAREEKLVKVKNPQTLEDYAYKKRYFGLSDEETIQYENLYAEERRKAREEKKAAKTTKDTSGADAFFANADNYTIEKTTHTKTGEDVWVVRPASRLETEQWKQLNEQMKALGGSYWRGNQGWNFKKDPTAALSSTEETETATVKGSTNAEKLRAVAEGMQKAIDDKFRDRLTNTAKRAREAASAEAEGERLKRLQDTINNIADALENGENTLLDKIDSKAQVETLMSMLRTGRRNRISETLPDITYDERLQEQDKPYSNDDAKYAEYPLTKLHESAITEYIRAAEGKTGYKQITDRLKKSLKSVKNGYVTVDAQMFADIDKIVRNLSTYRADFWNDGVAERKRLARMGIENVVELRAYLREFIKFLPGKDADAERQRNIKAKERQLANAKIEGFFPTPKAIVEKMLDEADIKPGEKVLEPSAGKGNIADAIRENYPDNALDVVEWNASLNELLSKKGHNVVGVDFLQHSGEYDKIIMNPPFEKGQDIDHIRHAYSLLNDGGRVVCIMSEGPFFRSDKKATEFREWLDSLGGVSEKLPEGAFKSSERSTGVNTRLVVIDKVASTTKPTKSKSGVKSSRDNATESSRADRWSTDRVADGTESKSTVSVSEIIEQISTEFGIPISTGKVTDSEASGIYKEKPETIRTRISNNLPTISHELGHHLDKKYNLNELGSVDSIRAIVSDEFLDQYPDDAVNGELVAEFVRRYLKNSNEANRLCPEFYNDFVRTLSKEDLAAVNRVAKQVNEYLSYDIDKRYESSVISAKKAKKMQKLPFAERWKSLYTGWVDKFHPLKQITDYVSEIKGSVLSGIKNAYVLATNSLNAHTIANYQVLEGFRDLNGNFVDDAKSLIECIGMVNSKDITTLDLYLKLKHALEVIGKGKRVFADEVLEDTDNIKKKIAEIEKEHPEMVEAANNLYEFQYNMLKYFAVPSGIMTMEQVEYLHHEYPCYVPFYRFIKNKRSGMFAKSSFVNQGSPIMRQTGSGLDTLSHLESIIRNVEKIVKASTRNQTAAVLGSYADNVDGIGQFIEKVAPDMLPHTIDITTLKENFAKRLQEVVKSGDDFFAISGLMDEVFGDDVTDFTPIANESKKIISVMRGGERSYYQIHDDALFSAVAELSPQQVNGWIRVNNMIMQPMKLLITQNNPIFAATNALRDFGTAYKLSEIKKPLTFVVQYAKALGGIITNSEDYKKYKAMGGGHSSELSANIENISKTLRRVAEKDMGKARRLAYSIFRHPVDTVASINDAVESIPRFMEFERTLKENGDLQKAIFNASDITTNFKRSGSSNTAKFVNSSIMFNNAAIQGLDKMFRTITAKDPKKRYATLTKWLLHALIMGILGYLYNKEVDEEGYKNLSSYKKNNFYNFAIGDGKFISLPKPRENALLDTVTERTIEYLFGDNEEAFYDFGSYLGSQLLPPMLPDTLHPVDAVHSVGGSTIFGGLLDVGFNKDFKGTPIEGAYDKYTPSNERYTDSTTKLAYELGQTKVARDLDMSPKKIDHLISSYTGILGQVNKALFPMNEERKDTSIGLRNKFISDSNYSTDVLNRMYENQEKAEKAFTYSGTIDTAIEYEKNVIITSYISGMNKAVKSLPKDEQRNGRMYLLKTLNGWNYENTTSQTSMLSSLDGSTISTDMIFDELPSSTLEWTVNKQKFVYQMTPQEYHKYISNYLTVIENARKQYGSDSVENCEMAKEAAKEYMSKYKKTILKNQYFTKAVAKSE